MFDTDLNDSLGNFRGGNDDFMRMSATPELLKELENVQPGVLSLILMPGTPVEKIGHIFREVAMSLGLRYQSDIVYSNNPDLHWSIVARRVSAFAPDKPVYVIGRLRDIANPYEFGSFVRSRLFDVLDESDKPIELYSPRPRRVCCDREPLSHFSHQLEIEEDCATGAPSVTSDDIIRKMDREILLPSPSVAPFVPNIDETEEELGLEAEKRRWIDALSALIVGYVSRFNEAPPMAMIEEHIRGQILLTATKQSPVTVNGDMKIFLPGLNEIELRMTPLAATVYILFLCHPEGIRLKDIGEYKRELMKIYSMVKPGVDERLARESIESLVDPLGNSLQEKLSMTRRAVKRYILDPAMAKYYIIDGARGELYRISLPADMIHLPEILRRYE